MTVPTVAVPLSWQHVVDQCESMHFPSNNMQINNMHILFLGFYLTNNLFVRLLSPFRRYCLATTF